YAATLGLLVVAPRLLFALLELARARRVPVLELQGADWAGHLAALRASAGGGVAAPVIIAHGLALDEASRDRWRRMARGRWGDAVPAECRAVAPGDEAGFVDTWDADPPRVMLVFNL